MPQDHFAEFSAKMRAAQVSEPTIRAFEKSYNDVVYGGSALVRIREDQIVPVDELPRLEGIGSLEAGPDLLAQAVVLKLNGGLGTSMGMEGPKSLVQVKDSLTFLDIIARQILFQRQKQKIPLRLILMNSFNTSVQTTEFLARYPELGASKDLELMQSKVPKVDAQTLQPIAWPEDPELEWCPPGHGDIYPSLVASGWLPRLLKEGLKYLFVSNSDNLGATFDARLLAHFAASGRSFLMEVAERTPADKKGGHLARSKDGKLILRERAQCPQADMAAFEDIALHRYFNTNNLWIRLDYLDKLVSYYNGFLPLPVIKNAKTVDPRNKNSPGVLQLETAMGAALECFENAPDHVGVGKGAAIVVPRTRFAPVKTTVDLMVLRSDAYMLTEDWQMVLAPARRGLPPKLSLDSEHYGLIDQLDSMIRDGVPSLVDCEELTVKGPVLFQSGCAFRGKVKITNRQKAPMPLPQPVYADCEVEL